MNSRVCTLNCPIDICDSDFALNMANNAIIEGNNFHIITINPEMIMNAQQDDEFLSILSASDLNIADGIGVKLALKFKNINLQHTRGIDLARKLIDLADKNNYKVAFLGAKEEVIRRAEENFLNQYSSLNIVYARNGYFSDDFEIIEQIKQSGAQIILIGLGSPKQEKFILELKNHVQGCVMIGVGGSFDVFSGITKESPVIFRKLGLEWLYRTITQPKRLKRIFPTLPLFLIKCIIESVQKKG